MRLIMTHEQTDFDAIASLLGAFLIGKNEIALLPRQMNRNVQSLLNLYQTELPFTHLDDLTRDSIETITLVDTQSLITIKGLTKGTQITVVDHHPRKNNLPKSWEFIETKTGATTSYFVQQLQRKATPLSKVMASLLLLGIYEDTGSLTYSCTTPVDVHAAAFLLEQGAYLDIIAEYLNPPLSSSQRSLMDQLVKFSITIKLEDQTIIVSSADGTNVTDEISSIAHKMFNLLTPDALFIFVNTNEGVRLVARSISDHINVARITVRFGGGGHERAASALIRPITDKSPDNFLEELVSQFIKELPALVTPGSKVGQIMSRQPLLITPTTTAQEAMQLMQQYGYEGYPVVQHNKVIGLLTRRAVDRAITHKLNLPAISLMDAGGITISPDDSLEKLQYLMSSSGWGQVPVIDPESKEVIGIVTRTDLLKSLIGNNNGFGDKINLSSVLEENLPTAKLALIKLISTQAAENNLPIYLVGGLVRDILLKQSSQDLDFVVEGDAIPFARTLAAEYGGKISNHRKFGTAKWIIGTEKKHLSSQFIKSLLNPAELPSAVDLISARTEFYSYPTALPTVKQGSIKLDLQRRDFTINTMAIRLDGNYYGELYDFWGGSKDLNQGFIRVLHSLSFVDDPTRILRAVRFEQRLNFKIEARTMQLLRNSRPLLKQISGDRIRHELDLILSGKHSFDIFHRLQELGLLTCIHPEFIWKDEYSQSLEQALIEPINKKWGLAGMVGNIPTQRFIAYLIILSSIPPTQVNAIAKRLHLSAVLKSALIQSNSLLIEFPNLLQSKPSKIVRRLDTTPAVVLYAIHLLAPQKSWQELIHQFQTKWKKVKPITSGETLKRLHLSPGPIYQKFLSALRAAWLDEEIKTKEEEETLLKKLLKNIQ
jgi:tRNA nucleotidyltransferase (CCA-adding enzyme)